MHGFLHSRRCRCCSGQSLPGIHQRGMSRCDSIVIETINSIENPVTQAAVHPSARSAHGLGGDPENGRTSWTVGIHGGDSNPNHAGFRIALVTPDLSLPCETPDRDALSNNRAEGAELLLDDCYNDGVNQPCPGFPTLTKKFHITAVPLPIVSTPRTLQAR